MKGSFIILFLSVLQFQLLGHSLRGVVYDQDEEVVVGAQILNLSKGNHVHTNQEGEFFIENVSLGDTLHISYFGYITKKIEVNNLTDRLIITLNADPVLLEEVEISPKVNALKQVTDIDIRTSPVTSSQEILPKVPGLFIGQHAGGGKAEQIFLRGFDIDHGTDISITVDNMPVNKVSHAHGQGYADLHFVIPETIEKIDWGKGPYQQNKGNFATAGYVNFQTKEELDNSLVKFEMGQFSTQRLVTMSNLVNSKKHDAYLATEYLVSDGPFKSSQNFNRLNLFGKYTGKINQTDKIGATISYFTSDWDASGQIPQRAVDNGLIGRFGAIDDTEGGQTSRANFLIHHEKEIDEKSTLKSTAYLTQYNFELYSNFTFFLDDATNGDQIRQKESRLMYGFTSEYNRTYELGKSTGEWFAGISLRNDQVTDNELSKTRNRDETLNRVQLGNVNESNWAAHMGTLLNINKWSFKPSLRIDYFDFQYEDELQTAYTKQSADQSILSPKFDVYYNPSQNVQFYVKTGKGFHSNDTRVSVAQSRKTLPAAYGFDVGYIWKLKPNILLNMAYWYLYLEQEFVYLGDAGIVEPSGKTRRHGVEMSLRYQIRPWLNWNVDANYTHARAIEEPNGQDFIPLAPDLTLKSGVLLKHKSGFYGGVELRYLDDRPANEDNSIVAKGYTVTDVNMGYKWESFDIGFQVQNLFNIEWNETQFATESRLQSESSSVEEIHFTPGTPFMFRGIVSYRF